MNAHDPLQTKRNAEGFTLMEVMVTMGIFCLVLPGILATSLHLQRNVRNGLERNALTASARTFELRFTKAINESRKNIAFDENTDTLMFMVYDETSQDWADSWYIYSKTSRKVIDCHSRTILRNAYPAEGHSSVFSISGKQARFHIDLKSPGGQKFRISGSVTPRNK